MDGFGFNNFIEVIMATLMKGGGLIKEDVTKKLCFGVDGAFLFRGVKHESQRKFKKHGHHFQ
jgi:hypothetical protein